MRLSLWLMNFIGVAAERGQYNHCRLRINPEPHSLNGSGRFLHVFIANFLQLASIPTLVNISSLDDKGGVFAKSLKE